jgi:D-alanine-D-alanine ligase
MKICVLQSSYETGDTTSVFKDVDVYSNPAAWLKDHDCHNVFIRKATAMMQIRDLAKQNFDMFINLCDGAWDEDRAGIEVVKALERFNLPFTGCSSYFYEPSKENMKMVAYYMGVRTPNFVFAYDDAGIEEAIRELTYPMIVKHFNGYSSIGMTKDSRCTTAEGLREQARKMIDAFGGALIEEFIDGKEFTVLVAENPENPSEPIAYIPAECAFPKGESFKHFDLKWIDFDGMTWTPVTDKKIADEIKDMGKKMFLGFNGDSYARCDLRMDQQGRIFMLEINPYCGIFYPPATPGSADCILSFDPITHRGFLDHIFRCSKLRAARNKDQKIEIRFKPSTGYTLYAGRDIKAGEVLVQWEERAQHLVTKQWVDKTWNSKQKSWFDAYAFPLIGDTYVMWSDKVQDWKPLNHSCDPNSWLEGLNQVARRDIKKHEPITIEYATFCGENMKEFQCLCKSSSCRKTIRPTDHQLPFVEELYGGHVSDWVKEKRKELKHKHANGNGNGVVPHH